VVADEVRTAHALEKLIIKQKTELTKIPKINLETSTVDSEFSFNTNL
jgi:hypothetical protein